MRLFTVQAFWNRTDRPSVAEVCSQVVEYLNQIRSVHPIFERWFLQAGTADLAKATEVTNSLDIAGHVPAPRREEGMVFGLWNGQTDGTQGVSIRVVDGWMDGQVKNGFMMSLPPATAENEALFSRKTMLEVLLAAISVWDPYWGTVLPVGYEGSINVFPDRRGVGWMVYVNAAINANILLYGDGFTIVPAGSGTILIATDELFLVERAGHVNVANQIEIHLAGMGLLPKL